MARAEFLKNLIYPIQLNKFKLKYKNAKSKFIFDLRCKPIPFSNVIHKIKEKNGPKYSPGQICETNCGNREEVGELKDYANRNPHLHIIEFHLEGVLVSRSENVKNSKELMSKLINIMRYMFKN